MANGTDPFFVAVIGAIAGYGGAILQAWAAKNFERERFGRQSRYDAYGLYLKALGNLNFSKDEGERAAGLSAMVEARGRVALYGSPEVVAAMAKAFRRGTDIYSDLAMPDHTAMIEAMRADVDPRSKAANPQDLFELLFGNSRKDGGA